MNRLTSTTTSYNFTSAGPWTVQYGYDAASNRTSMTDPQGTQTIYGAPKKSKTHIALVTHVLAFHSPARSSWLRQRRYPQGSSPMA
jgi:YD repeat-containing protein